MKDVETFIAVQAWKRGTTFAARLHGTALKASAEDVGCIDGAAIRCAGKVLKLETLDLLDVVEESDGDFVYIYHGTAINPRIGRLLNEEMEVADRIAEIEAALEPVE